LWNKSGLREKFVGTQYGIIGDMGFTFNRVVDKDRIWGFAPKKRNRGQAILPEEIKSQNAHISSVRVTVEHYFARLKAWRVFKSKFRQHSAMRHSMIDFGHVLFAVTRLIEWLQDQESYDPSHPEAKYDAEVEQ
jgi:hypothetical protein